MNLRQHEIPDHEIPDHEIPDLDAPELEEVLRLQPQGRLGINEVGELLDEIRRSEGALELDLTAVDSMDLCAVQFIVTTVPALAQRHRKAVVIDSEAGVLRSVLELSGIRPELAGLSARFTL